MNTKQILTEALDLIATPSGWCQGYQAITLRGRQVVPGSPHARLWDIEGAILRAGGREYGPRVVMIAQKHAQACGYANLSALNDQSDHAVVAAFLKGVIEDV